MTLPRADKEVLMAAPSFKRAPVAPVESARSLHAKKTRFISERNEHEMVMRCKVISPGRIDDILFRFMMGCTMLFFINELIIMNVINIIIMIQ